MDLEGRNLALVGVQTSGHFRPVYGFVRQYVSHLLAALERIEGEHAEQNKSRREHAIKFEVDMALALSAKGFTWSNALKSKLEKERDIAVKKSVHVLPFQNPEIEGNMSLLFFPQPKTTEGCNLNINHFGSAPNKYSTGQECCEDYSDPYILKGKVGELECDKNCWKNTKKYVCKRKAINVGKTRYKRWRLKSLFKCQWVSVKMVRKIKAKKALQSRIKILKSLTPGGNGMDTDVLFNELGNYISCLQIQVKVLHHLAESSGIMLPSA